MDIKTGPRADTTRFAALEGSRAILALWVLFGHALQQTGWSRSDLIWPFTVLHTAGQAVIGFMIVSGFAIAHLVTMNPEPYRLYIWRRWLRLFPLLALTLAVAVGVHSLWPSIIKYDDSYLGAYLAANALMLHGVVPVEWLPDYATALNGPAWSVSLEWQFYLMAPLLVAMVKQRRVGFTMLAVVAFLIFRSGQVSLLGHEFSFDQGAFLPVRIIYFLIGIASYQILMGIGERRVDVFAVATVCVCVLLDLKRIYPFALWALVMLAIAGNPIFDRLLSGSIMRYLGRISFSIYLMHGFVLLLVKHGFLLSRIEMGTPVFFVALLVPTLVLTVAVAHLTYRSVEQPFINLGKYGRLTVPPVQAAPAP